MAVACVSVHRKVAEKSRSASLKAMHTINARKRSDRTPFQKLHSPMPAEPGFCSTAGVLREANLLLPLPSDTSGSREGHMAEVMGSRGAAHARMFALELLREHIGAYGIVVHAGGGRATLCVTDVDECPPTSRVCVDDASRVRVLGGAMASAMQEDAHFLLE
ncbi:UNVERIFIED_CONTAM: hypothetical protein PYX00_011512 [Menopon gallinae]|uniref:Uncharacterized protein n=1 Tax=Menopon gallinae TaxID=328185 RepID=A0AAW2H809_9NEOP